MIEPSAQDSVPNRGTHIRRLRDDNSDRRVQSPPFEVRIGTTRQGRFEDVRDAIASARISKNDHPLSRICAAVLTTAQIVVEVEY
jgi:hypothetical protein